ncbi:hypothetical protein HDV57DRAFT_500041 [Trichoderma longibrachiatum]
MKCQRLLSISTFCTAVYYLQEPAWGAKNTKSRLPYKKPMFLDCQVKRDLQPCLDQPVRLPSSVRGSVKYPSFAPYS